MTQLASGKQFVCGTCGAHSPEWGMCKPKGLGASVFRHDWVPVPECMSCEDTGYEPGVGLYCTFCKAGYAVATRQMRAGVSPWGR